MGRINVDEEAVNVVFEIVFVRGFSAVVLIDEIYICPIFLRGMGISAPSQSRC
jgi:hypothetical protein